MIQAMRAATTSLRRQPLLALGVVLTLGLGLGMTTALFSVVSGVVLQPLPYPGAEQLVHLHRFQPPVQAGPISRPDFLEIAAGSDAELQVAGFEGLDLTLIGEGPAERLAATQVSAGFFELFGMTPLVGRWLGEADQAPDAAWAAVIGEGLWERRFQRRDEVIGRSIRVSDGRSVVIVGVAPRAFAFPDEMDLWMPARYPTGSSQRGSNHVQMVGRVGDGVALERIEARMQAAAARMAEQAPDNYTGLEFRVRPLLDYQIGNVSSGLWLLLGAVALLLLVVCGNVANLLLTRTLSRWRELATRSALGASGAQLARQVFSEALVLAVAGLLAGLVIAQLMLKPLLALAPAVLPRTGEVTLDWQVFGFAALAALMAGALCGLAPAALARSRRLTAALAGGGKQAQTALRASWRKALVTLQLALAFVLCAGAALLVGTVGALSRVDPGFDTANLLTARILLPVATPTSEAEIAPHLAGNWAFSRELVEALEATPGVLSASIVDTHPLAQTNNWNGSISVEGREPYPPGQAPTVEFRWVTPGNFETLGIPLVAGRMLRADESLDPFPIVVNRAFVERVFPGEDPIGQRIGVLDGQSHTIVGVVGDTRQWGLDREVSPEAYFPYQQALHPLLASVVVRTSVAPETLAETLRRVVARINPEVPVFALRTMDEVMERTYGRRAFFMLLMAVFAAVGVVVAAIGLYAVMAFAVAQRTQEIGVRMALGASRSHVLRGVLVEGVRLAVVGLGIGLVLALFGAGLLESQLFGVGVRDPALFALAALVLLAVALLAAWLPARRAAEVTPMQALRYE